jgi:hypothetical protein
MLDLHFMSRSIEGSLLKSRWDWEVAGCETEHAERLATRAAAMSRAPVASPRAVSLFCTLT